jgi:hypothetical protein
VQQVQPEQPVKQAQLALQAKPAQLAQRVQLDPPVKQVQPVIQVQQAKPV